MSTQSHICDAHIIIHLTINNLLWHISHKATKPLERKLLQLDAVMTVNSALCSWREDCLASQSAPTRWQQIDLHARTNTNAWKPATLSAGHIYTHLHTDSKTSFDQTKITWNTLEEMSCPQTKWSILNHYILPTLSSGHTIKQICRAGWCQGIKQFFLSPD